MRFIFSTVIFFGILVYSFAVIATPEGSNNKFYPVCQENPIDSLPVLAVGDKAPDFKLKSIDGEEVALNSYLGKKYLVISFVPAAWTPVCSLQWPEYNEMQSVFQDHDAVLLGISADNIPSLYSWIKEFGGVWFRVLSEFWPHGEIAKKYGVLRSDGRAERALFVIDKQGIIRYIDVHDLNQKPSFSDLVVELQKLKD
ncbi:MAG: redoxin domain-containing protein [Candidatus Omnitrophica bacterium]|nr:redoxin domain-containing protein [Candidatus Omnitrophota bacterium]